MKKLTGILAAIVFAVSAHASNGDSEKTLYEVDTKASKVYWTGKKVSGEHTGYLSIGNGNIHVKGNEVVSAEINMDLNTIECTDLSGEWKDKLIGHLKSEDFFSAEKYPNAIFKIKSVKGEKVVGDLTIKGITHEISFPADVSVANGKVIANGTASIDRTKWDIKYGSGKFFSDLGDKMISDEFEIKFELTAISDGALSAK